MGPMDRELDDLTSLLRAWSGGDAEAEAKLLPLVYDQLRRQAAHQLRRERPGRRSHCTPYIILAFALSLAAAKQ